MTPTCHRCGEALRLDECTWTWEHRCGCSDESVPYQPEAFTKEQAIERLNEIANGDHGTLDKKHILADRLLLDLINDPDITAAWTAVGRWYS